MMGSSYGFWFGTNVGVQSIAAGTLLAQSTNRTPRLKAEVDARKKFICTKTPDAEICGPLNWKEKTIDIEFIFGTYPRRV